MSCGRHFLLTGQTLSAHDAQALGQMNEVLPADQVLARAWEHARLLAARPMLLLLGHTRLISAVH
jgi:enoyl-CoA hydratase/carnithine racemase